MGCSHSISNYRAIQLKKQSKEAVQPNKDALDIETSRKPPCRSNDFRIGAVSLGILACRKSPRPSPSLKNAKEKERESVDVCSPESLCRGVSPPSKSLQGDEDEERGFRLGADQPFEGLSSSGQTESSDSSCESKRVQRSSRLLENSDGESFANKKFLANQSLISSKKIGKIDLFGKDSSNRKGSKVSIMSPRKIPGHPDRFILKKMTPNETSKNLFDTLLKHPSTMCSTGLCLNKSPPKTYSQSSNRGFLFDFPGPGSEPTIKKQISKRELSRRESHQEKSDRPVSQQRIISPSTSRNPRNSFSIGGKKRVMGSQASLMAHRSSSPCKLISMESLGGFSTSRLSPAPKGSQKIVTNGLPKGEVNLLAEVKTQNNQEKAEAQVVFGKTMTQTSARKISSFTRCFHTQRSLMPILGVIKEKEKATPRIAPDSRRPSKPIISIDLERRRTIKESPDFQVNQAKIISHQT